MRDNIPLSKKSQSNTNNIIIIFLNFSNLLLFELQGYALDGFTTYGPFDDTAEVDECNGRVDDNGDYGYHILRMEQVDGKGDYCLDEGFSPVNNWNYILSCYSGSLDGIVVTDSSTFDIPSDCVLDLPTQSPTLSTKSKTPKKTKKKNNIRKRRGLRNPKRLRNRKRV